jgi:hypothetical protein
MAARFLAPPGEKSRAQGCAPAPAPAQSPHEKGRGARALLPDRPGGGCRCLFPAMRSARPMRIGKLCIGIGE